ncbi:MAG TPA: zinc ABC transporter substrate-binding protein [Eubacteriales bacterium]|nr:zinc ABC transporter substrate-binding protein [Eubacteriales bacterium]
MKNISKILCLVIAFALVIVSSAGCTPKITNDKITVAVTIVPLAGFVKAVCGDKVNVITLIPPGYSPATYEPTPQQMIEFSDANICFAVGVPAEESMLSEAVPTVIRLQDIVSEVYPDRYFDDGGRDPHIWLSVKRVKIMVTEIASQMSALDPVNADYYQSNAEEYLNQLDEVDLLLKAAVNEMDSKQFIVFHPAFGYLAEDYGLNMVALEEEGKEATAAHLQEVIDFAKAEGIKAIFYQEEIDSKQAQSFAEEIGGATVMLSPLAENYIENILSMINTIKEVNSKND